MQSTNQDFISKFFYISFKNVGLRKTFRNKLPKLSDALT